MCRLPFFSLLLIGLASASAQAQGGGAPLTPTQRNVGERVSPLPGVTLPAGVNQNKIEPVPAPTQVRPNGVLPQPVIPRGDVTAGPVDSGQVQPAKRNPATPARPQTRRP
ncbi:hypothetical protein [Hymenobacter sp. YC55]|uniref:hypothetical protein n=1 Tax=Hymenobacter sp. YC55 TaxID=3034019 RepID=UPI0023F6C918|nr:hypothetical protein [Hymenobacter sp. YC55]MDF7812598.1 hypothetical protein [Hymenobacter sp. YC55]